MIARRATVMLRRTVPPATLVPYAAALATVVLLAVLMSYAARRLTSGWVQSVPPMSVALQTTSESGRAARATPVSRGKRADAVPSVKAGQSGKTESANVAAMPPAIEELRRRRLGLPVNGLRADQLVPTFDEARGDRPHEAIDIMSPRGTPVVATEDGRIAKLFWSKAGGHTIYQFDPSQRYAYYYAHLDRYADGLAEGQAVTRGQTIGYVGSTGNANTDAPHLHFAILLLTPEKRWWDGAAIDPHPVLRWNIDGSSP